RPAAPALMLRARYTRRGRLLLVDASIIEAIPVGFTGQDLLRGKLRRDDGPGRAREEPVDLLAVLAAQDRARRVHEPAARRPLQLDVRGPAHPAERAARRVDQRTVARLPVPPTGRRRRVALHERRGQPETRERRARRVEARRIAVHGDELAQIAALEHV